MKAGGGRPAESRRQVISFRLEPDLLGIDLSYVEKVIDAGPFSFVPRAPAFVVGAVSLKGKVLAVIDLRRFLDMPPQELTVESKVLLLAHEVYQAGLLVDRVERIESVPLAGPLVSTPAPGETNPYVSRLINLGGRILSLLEVDKLLADIETYFA